MPPNVRPASSRVQRRDQILRTAVALFNRDGYSATGLEDVAQALGLSRTAVYYYFKSKDELAHACCEQTTKQHLGYLAQAAEQPGTAAEKLGHFLTLEFAKQEGPMVDLVAATELSLPYQEQVAALMRQVSQGLHALIMQGIQSGTLRSHRPEVLTEALMSICYTWAVPERLGFTREFDTEAAAQEVNRYLCRGLLPGNRRQSWLEQKPRQLSGFPQCDLDPADRYLARRDRILANTLTMVNRRGFSGSTMDELGDMLGIAKGSIYHYAPTKESLLLQSYDRALRMLERCEAAAIARGGSAAEVSQRMAHYCIRAHGTHMGPLPVYNALHAIQEQNRNFLNVRRWALRSSATQRSARSIAEGDLRPCNPSLLQTIRTAIIHGLPRWYDENEHGDLLSVEREIQMILALGIVTH